MQTHDSIQRRYRLVRPSPDFPFEFIRQPKGTYTTLTDRDHLLLEKINIHGPLSSSTLRDFSQSVRKDGTRATKRLSQLYHEHKTPHGGPYLERPSSQRNHCNSFLDDLIYDLMPSSEKALAEKGVPIYPRDGWWLHQFMTAYITSSIDLATIKVPPLRFIPQHEITTNRGVKFAYKDPEHPDPIEARLVPDALFGVQFPDGRKRHFMLETDRKTERINPHKSFTKKSIRRLILQYRKFIGGGLYKEAYGIDKGGMILLFVTTNQTHQRNIIDLAKELSGDGTGINYMLFKSLPLFERSYFKPPKPDYNIFTRPWDRAGRDPFPIWDANAA